MMNTEGLASAEICYQHLACRNNEEELVSSESGMAMPWKGPFDISCGDRQNLKISSRISLVRARGSGTNILTSLLLSFPVSCLTPPLAQPRKRSGYRGACVVHSMEVGLQDQKAMQQRTGAENGMEKQLENSQSIDLSPVWEHVYTEFIELGFLGQQVDSLVIFIELLIFFC